MYSLANFSGCNNPLCQSYIINDKLLPLNALFLKIYSRNTLIITIFCLNVQRVKCKLAINYHGTMKGMKLDLYDLRLIRELCSDASKPLVDIGKSIGIFSPSSISRRTRHLIDNGYVKQFTASVNYEKLGYEYTSIILVEAKYGKNYTVRLGQKLVNLPGVVSAYNTSGDIDFIIYALHRNKEDYLVMLDKLTEIEEIERTDTRQVHRTFKEMDVRSLFTESRINELLNH